MKRINNKYRNNNNNNQIYSLNYKFDSSSIAGKFSGTALELIKRYNELAKDAAGDNDYVTAEVFRQYAEHYRKIVTEINEKKNQNRMQFNQNLQNIAEEQAKETANEGAITNETTPQPEASTTVEKKSFTIIEVPHSEAESAGESSSEPQEPVRKKRVYRRRQAVAE